MKRGAWKTSGGIALLVAACLMGSASAETATYTYDELGRLKTVTRSSGAVTTYSYDANDNRTSVVVTGGLNNNPVAVTDTATTPMNTTLNFDPRSNDTDADGDSLTITAKTNGSHGTVSIAGGGTGLSYVPTTSYTGSDSFTYTISDGHGGTAVGTVNVTVQAALAASIDVGSWDAVWYGTDTLIPPPDVTCSGSGGTGPYTYLWIFVSGDTHLSVNTSGTVATTGFTNTATGYNYWAATFRCRVTDSASNTATVDIPVSFDHEH